MRVSLLLPHYVRAYVRSNKTDRADATALLEASRARDIIPVRVKSPEQQALQGVHRVRSAWRAACRVFPEPYFRVRMCATDPYQPSFEATL